MKKRRQEGSEGGGDEKEEWVCGARGAAAVLLRLEAIKLNIEFLPYRERSVHCKDQPVNVAKGNNDSLLWESHKAHTHNMAQRSFFFF